MIKCEHWVRVMESSQKGRLQNICYCCKNIAEFMIYACVNNVL